ncbi:MAG: hypothetical protein H0X64_09800 [Gemmatimonadaceae bacterium]|nr:hypothetical protein [Gemmatimonadaceae bacterium]
MSKRRPTPCTQERLSGWLSRLHSLPLELLLFVGVMNLLYASYSFSLAVRAERPLSLITLLVSANAAWVLVCLMLAMTYRQSATVFGIGHLVGEAVFVGALAVAEWTQRGQLATR